MPGTLDGNDTMSDRTERWARWRANHPAYPRLTFSERSLLIILAGIHSEVGATQWPTMPQLADLVGLTERRVQGIIYALSDKGAITYQPGRGRGNACSYSFPMTEKDEISDNDTAGKDEISGDVPSIKDEISGEKTKSPTRKDEILEPEKTKSLTPDGEPKGGEYRGGTGSTTSPSPTVSPKPTETPTRGGSKPKKAKKSVEEITADLQAEYADLWSGDEVQGIVDYALSYKTSKNWTDIELGLKRWLARDARDERQRREARSNGRTPAATGPRPRAPDPYDRFG